VTVCINGTIQSKTATECLALRVEDFTGSIKFSEWDKGEGKVQDRNVAPAILIRRHECLAFWW
jgi:hypothetical protein